MSAHTSSLDNLLEPLSQSRAQLLAALESVSDQYFNTSLPGKDLKADFEYWSICDIAWYVGALDDVCRLRVNDIVSGREVRSGEISQRPQHVNSLEVILIWLSQSRAALCSSLSRSSINQLQDISLLFKESLSQCEIILGEVIANEAMSTRRIWELVEMFGNE